MPGSKTTNSQSKKQKLHLCMCHAMLSAFKNQPNTTDFKVYFQLKLKSEKDICLSETILTLIVKLIDNTHTQSK